MSYKVVALKTGKELARFPTQQMAMEWVEDLLEAVKKTSLLSHLNDIQIEFNDHSPGVKQEDKLFPDKFEMPLGIINGILRKHGIQIKA